MSDIRYEDFDVFVYAKGEGSYGARVVFPNGSAVTQTFDSPCSLEELGEFRAQFQTLRGGASAATAENRAEGAEAKETALVREFAPEATRADEMGLVREFGGKLYAALFKEGIRDHYKALYFEAARKHLGIRVRLDLGEAPDLLVLPWEMLFDEDAYQFLALSEKTPVVRHLGVSSPTRPLDVTAPLRVLVLAPEPPGLPALSVKEEWRNLEAAMAGLEEDGKVVLEAVEPPTLRSLRERLSSNTDYHVLHFIGHGVFDAEGEGGYLALEREGGGLDRVDGALLAEMLRDHVSLRLVVLNSCQGATTSASHPFAGLAQSLVRQEVPAVIAMQSAITDRSAVEFSESFYRAIGLGRPLEAAVAAGRMAVRSQVSLLEWATPVFYTRLDDGVLFQISEVSPENRQLLRDKETLAELWTPREQDGRPREIVLVFGMVREEQLEDQGELEPVVALSYALMMGELSHFLQTHYDLVRLAKGSAPDTHGGPVVYLGGPVTIPEVAEVVDRHKLPYWFQGLPYGPGSTRCIGKPGVAYLPELDGDSLVSDVGVAARIEDGGTLSFLVSGCYGAGTLGAARFLLDPEQVRSLGELVRAPRLEVVVKSVVSGWDVATVEPIASVSW